MVSIHPPPLSSTFSSPPGPPSQSQVSRLARERLSSVERRWAPSLGCGMGMREGGPHMSVELGPRSHHGVWVCISRSQKKHYPRTALPSGWLLPPFQSWVMVSWFLVT